MRVTPQNIEPRIAASDLQVAISIARRSSTFDLVHAHGLRAAWISSVACSLRPFPLIVTLHNLPAKSVLWRLAMEFICRRAVRTICVSQAIKDHASIESAVVIPNGVQISRFSSKSREESRQLLGLRGADFVVVCVARLAHEKGVDLLVEAATTIPSVVVLIAGDGPERADLRTRAPANVRFLGQVSDPAELYAAADLVVVPSREEGQGLVALEAMAAGAPVIATRVGGLIETIVSDRTGLLIEPESTLAISVAIQELRDEPGRRERLSSAGRDFVFAHRTADSMMAAIQETYLSAIDGS